MRGNAGKKCQGKPLVHFIDFPKVAGKQLSTAPRPSSVKMGSGDQCSHIHLDPVLAVSK